MITPFDDDIERLSREIEEKRSLAETRLGALFNRFAEAVQKALEPHVLAEAKAQHEVFNGFTDEQVAQMKRELVQVLAGVPAAVADWFKDDGHWAHRKNWAQGARPFTGYFVETGEGFTTARGDNAMDVVRGGTDLIFWRFMRKHGFRNNKTTFITGTKSDEPRRYDVPLQWTQPMYGDAAVYRDAYKAYAAAQLEVKRVQDQRGRFQADQRWRDSSV